MGIDVFRVTEESATLAHEALARAYHRRLLFVAVAGFLIGFSEPGVGAPSVGLPAWLVLLET